MCMRPGCYTRVESPPYTKRQYMRGVPEPRIRKFTMGNTSRKFQYEVALIALKACQIRHNALEAARVAANRYLQRKLGVNNYLFRILPFPHHVLRENKMIFGAGADRLQDGMRGAFGKPVGTAAQVRANQKVAIVRVDEEGLAVAKEALRRSGMKIPTPFRIVIERLDSEEKD